jgi:hypothetical protein
MAIAIGLAGIALVVLWIARYWNDSNSKDMGRMSEKWIAEYNASQEGRDR